MVITVLPVKDKIFVNIASYRDPLLANTIEQAYKNATYKQNIVFGVVEQAYEKESLNLNLFPFKKQIRYLRVEPEQSRGCCWSRSIAQSMWQGEEYYLQIDSHTEFDRNWDSIYLNKIAELKRWHDKPIITGYPHGFDFKNGVIIKHTRPKDPAIDTIQVVSENCFVNGYYVHAKGGVYNTTEEFTHGFMLSAGSLFTLGSFVEEIPYDPFLFFNGEEQSLALRAWTKGYNLFHTSKIPLYHCYDNSYRKMYWDSDEIKLADWKQLEKNSMERLQQIVTGEYIGSYGIGNERSIEDFAKWSGIDYENKICDTKAHSGNEVFKLDYKQKYI